MTWAPERVAEFKSAYLEFERHVVVDSKEGGRICLGDRVYESQNRLLDGIGDGLAAGIHDVKVLKSRQLGISTRARAIGIFWLGLFDGLKGAMIFDTGPNKDYAHQELVQMIEGLPASVDFPRIKRNNRDMLVLANGSTVQFRSAGSRASRGSKALGTSLGINLLIASEMLNWQDQEGVISLQQALAKEYENRLFVWESTARGYEGIWYDMWNDAVADEEGQKTIFVGWWSHPLQRFERDSRRFARYGSEPPTEREKRRIDAVREAYTWEVTQEQLAWYRWYIDPARQPEDEEEAQEDNRKTQEQPWCLVAGTRVGTARGILRLDQLVPGDETALGAVLHAGQTGVARIWRARTALGYMLEGTANHPLISTAGREVELSDSLGVSVRLQAPRLATEPYTVTWRAGIERRSIEITPDFARFIGLFMGDGSIQYSPRSGYVTKITCDAKDLDVVQEIERLFRDLFGLEPTRKTSFLNGKPSWIDVLVSSKQTCDSLIALGLIRTDYGPTKRKVHVPEFIWRSPAPVVREFLCGFFEADGFADRNGCRIVAFSKYSEFMQDVQLLLLAVGITSKRSTEMKRGGVTGQYRYIGDSLSLRREETKKFAREIGFISARKRDRSVSATGKRRTFGIPCEDTVVLVEDTERTEPVFNLAVTGERWFDAYGIVTHNTESEAFQLTGNNFFEPGVLSRRMEVAAREPAQSRWTYYPGADFLGTEFAPARSRQSQHLTVWEEPLPGAAYVVAGDVAFGHDERNDRSVAQVLRCYADGVDQVAEFVSASTPTHQFAWLILALCGWYAQNGAGIVAEIVEINGPGDAVMREMDNVRKAVMRGHLSMAARSKGLRDIFNNVRQYMYKRSDAALPGSNREWKTTGPLKVSIMERLRDEIHRGRFLARSPELLREMATIVRDGDSIAAGGSAKDDRVITCAIGLRAWEDRLLALLEARRMTREADRARVQLSPEARWRLFSAYQIDAMFSGKKQVRLAQAAQEARAKWRYR